MKNILCCILGLICFVAMQQKAYAQSPPNWDFDQFNTSGGWCDLQYGYCRLGNLAPFQSCGIQNSAWYASHGTPEVLYRTSSDSYWASLWSGRWGGLPTIYGEGLFLGCDKFEKGKLYTINFTIKSCADVDLFSIDLVPLNQLQAMPATMDIGYEYEIPEVVGEQNIFKLENIQTEDLTQSYQVSFIPEEDYYRLWIWTKTDIYDYAIIYIDNFYFEDCSALQSNIIYEDDNIPSYTFAGNSVTTQYSALVSNMEFSQLVAQNFIDLLPNTTVELGSEFEAFIAPCSNNSLDCGINDAFPKTLSGDTNPFSFNIIGKNAMELNSKLLIQPNPARDNVVISSTEVLKGGRLQILNSTGAVIDEIDLDDSGLAFYNVDTLPKGVYTVILLNDKVTSHAKLVVY